MKRNNYSLTEHNIVPYDLHVSIPIRSRVFMPEADHVTQLVHNYAEFVAVLANRDGLGTIASFANERAAPKENLCNTP